MHINRSSGNPTQIMKIATQCYFCLNVLRKSFNVSERGKNLVIWKVLKKKRSIMAFYPENGKNENMFIFPIISAILSMSLICSDTKYIFQLKTISSKWHLYFTSPILLYFPWAIVRICHLNNPSFLIHHWVKSDYWKNSYCQNSDIST